MRGGISVIILLVPILREPCDQKFRTTPTQSFPRITRRSDDSKLQNQISQLGVGVLGLIAL